MKKLMIAAAVAAMGASAFAADWFNGGITGDWPSTAKGGKWSNTDNVTLVTNEVEETTTYALEVASPANAPLTFTATTPKSIEETMTTITSTMTFTPFQIGEMPEVPEGAKGGIIAVRGETATTWWVLLQNQAGDANEWFDTEVEASEDPVTVEIDNLLAPNLEEELVPNIAYRVDGVDVLSGFIVMDSADPISKACYAGEGSVTSLSAVYEGETPECPEWIDSDDTENVLKYAAWSEYYGVADPAQANKKAFLFNIANTDEAVENAEAAFKIKGITIVDGVVTIAEPEPADIGVELFNGEVRVGGCETIDGDYLLPQDDADARFFKAFLELIPAN